MKIPQCKKTFIRLSNVELVSYSFGPMGAPEDLAAWMAVHEHRDKTLPYVYRYHPRSDIHSTRLCELVVRDLLRDCAVLREQATRGEVAYGINIKHTWESGKSKALDLAIGTPTEAVPSHLRSGDIYKVRNPSRGRKSNFGTQNALSRLLIACEAKAAMTEHAKSQPRIFDELSSSHEIVHHGDQHTIAAGIVMVNIASTFASPLRQRGTSSLHFSIHDQPAVAARMIQHLRGLRIREDVGQVGFDAFCTFVVNCDNQTGCTLHTERPAPQPDDLDHYDTFISRLTRFYTERFADLRR